MKQYVEFYFPGLSVAGLNEKEVASRDVELIKPFPQYAFSFRFFEKNSNGNKVNYSNYYYIGEEYSIEDYKRKCIHQEVFDQNCKNVVKLITGGFRPLLEGDMVIS